MYTIHLTELSVRLCEVITSVVPVPHTDERLWLMALSRVPKSSKSVREELGLGSSQGVVPAEVWPWPDPRGTLEHHLHYRVAPIPADSWLPPVEGSVASQGCPSLDEVA